MNHKSSPVIRPDFVKPIQNEWKFVEKVAQEAVKEGLSTHRNDLVNLYISLKSKPLLILSGPPLRGKVALLNYLAVSLTEGNPLQWQTMIGHPWWANNDPNIAFFVNTQQRLNTERLLGMIEEAWQPHNLKKVYIAFLVQISPAELQSFFKDVAFQLQHGQIMRLGDAHLSEPIPYPPNLFILGTMNTDQFNFWEAGLMQKATIVQWPPETKRTGSSTSPGQNINFLSADFLGSSIRNETHACQKLHSVLGAYRTTDCQEPLLPLFRIENLINRFGMLLPSGWLAGVLIYLANSWTWEGEGLFARSTRRNLSKAMDFAIAQSVLPYVKDGIQAIDDLRISLKRILKGQFPYSASFIDRLASPVYNY